MTDDDERLLADLTRDRELHDQLLVIWNDVLADLSIAARSKWRSGRWTVVKGVAFFEVMNEWHLRACLQHLTEVEEKLWARLPNGPRPNVRIHVLEAPDDVELEVDVEAIVKASLGATIQEARSKVKLSQRELGNRVGVDQSAISLWERGSAIPSIDRLFRVDLALGLQPGTLLVRAGLVRPDAIEAAVRRAQDQAAANVSQVEIAINGSTRTMAFGPRLTVERWLELVRTMVGSEERALEVTEVTVTSAGSTETSWGDVPDQSKFEKPDGGLDLEEVLRIVELMLESQGEYEPPRRRADRYGDVPPPVAYDPNEEPF